MKPLLALSLMVLTLVVGFYVYDYYAYSARVWVRYPAEDTLSTWHLAYRDRHKCYYDLEAEMDCQKTKRAFRNGVFWNWRGWI